MRPIGSKAAKDEKNALLKYRNEAVLLKAEIKEWTKKHAHTKKEKKARDSKARDMKIMLKE